MEITGVNRIFEYLSDYLPPKWSNVFFYTIISEGRYSMKFFVDLGDGTMLDCLTQKNISRAKLIKSFSTIYNDLQQQREMLAVQDRWTVLLMRIKDDGMFNIKYEYDDVSNSFTEKAKEIENKIHQNMIGV